MKLYMHPVSNASRPVRLYIAEKKIECEEVLIDLMKGEHVQEPYAKLNPSKLVPMLEDGDLRLTESAAILRYLAGKYGHPEYPTDLKERAKVDELMDWFNTQFYRDFGYGLAYPQIFPGHKRPTDEQHGGVIAWGRDKAAAWFKVLDQHWLGGGKKWLRGDQITIADYFGGCLVTIGEVIRCDFNAYPNIAQWVLNLKKLESWDKVNEAMYGFMNYLKDQTFEKV
jgi:glutathione S-transferase